MRIAADLLGDKRELTEDTALIVANRLGARWITLGSVSSTEKGIDLLLDFVPVSSSSYAFRYHREVRTDALGAGLADAAEQFVRYSTRREITARTSSTGKEDSRAEVIAEALDRECGWFRAAEPGAAGSVFAAVARVDRGFAGVLFDPALYETQAAALAAPESQPVQEARPEVAGKTAPSPAAISSSAGPDPRRTEPPVQWTAFTLAPPIAPREARAALAPSAAPAPPSAPAPPAEKTSPPASDRRAPEPPPAPSSAPVESRPIAASAGMRYEVQVQASQVKEEAESVAERLRQAGFRPILRQADLGESGTYFRVRLGDYDSRISAAAAGDALVGLGLTSDYWIHSVHPAVEQGDPRTPPPAAERTRTPAAPTSEGEYALQIRSVQDQDEAVATADSLREAGLEPKVLRVMIKGKGYWYRVRLTGYPTEETAAAAAEKLMAQGLIREYWVIK
ncbi:MAG: hypothetical protein FJW35_03175 [Acidobacteria bacterium]|nr:hypothetical protein [Acidobacteriota bacterium]